MAIVKTSKKARYSCKACLQIAALICLLAWAAGPKTAEGQKTSPPNILLINIDDLGWRDLGYMGSAYYETPHIDQLAAQGMIFTHAYAAAANCAPSRAALFSGQWAPRTGVYTVGSSERGPAEHRKLIPVENRPHIQPDVLTIAQVLKAHGYVTCQVGKWHISKDPTDFGFDVNYGGAQYGHPPAGYFSPWKISTLKDGPKGTELTDRLTDLAIQFLETHREAPFFMNFATYAVHTPLQGKPELVARYKEKQGRYGQNNPTYAAMIETMDANVGRLIDCLKRTGQLDHTFIVFTSDNGGVYGITHQWPLRAGKGTYYEGGIRVPMVVVWPGKVRPGTASDQSVVNIDYFPTFLAVAGIAPPDGKVLDGRSFLPALQQQRLPERPLFWDFPVYLQKYTTKSQSRDLCFRTRPGASVHLGDWVLIQYYEDNHLELYNLGTDPGERKNLIHTFPQRGAALLDSLDQWRARVHAPVPTALNPAYKPGGCPVQTVLKWQT